MNLLFPVSVTASTICAVLLFQQATATDADAFSAHGYTLVATMMVLAILEHWFLVLPLSASRMWNGLWQWSVNARTSHTTPPHTPQGPMPRQATIGGRP
jgi:putative photosynthetic complex assembly protein 2